MFWEDIRDFLVKLFAVIGAGFVALLAFFVIFIHEDYEIDCQTAVVKNAGLTACWRDAQCNLDDGEIQEMYLSWKQAIISCASLGASSIYDHDERAPAEKQEKESATQKQKK